MNWIVRFKNPVYWIGLIGVIFTAMGVSPEMFTDWGIVYQNFIDLIKNPYMLVSVIVAIIGYNADHTTYGLRDSKRALTYKKPHKDDEYETV